MPDFEKLYHKMVHAAEDAISVLEQGNVWEARRILIDAEQYAEAQYIGESEPADGYNCLDSFSPQELRQLLLSELDTEEPNVEWIRRATAVLAKKDKSIAKGIDVNASYRDFIKSNGRDVLLYDEVLSDMGL